MVRKEIARLEQQKFGKGKQSFVLHEDGTLLVTLSKKGNFQQFSLPVAGWDPEPSHEKNSPWLSRVILKAVLVLICIMIVTMFGCMFASVATGHTGAAFVLAVILGGCWVLLYTQYLLQSYDVLIFRNPATGGQLVLHNNVPNEKEFSSFVEALKATIKKFPYIPLGETRTMVTELREYVRLRDEGVLTNEEFEEVKRKLLANVNSSSKMGFHL